MAKCNFGVQTNEPIDQVIEKAKDAINKAGGTFSGNTQSGSYSIPTPIGKIEGTYTVQGSTINFVITAKPLIVSCSTIEDKIKEYLK